MKLNFGRKLVLFLHWLSALAVCTLAVCLFVWPERVQGSVAQLANRIGAAEANAIGIALLAVYALISALTAVILFSGNRQKGERGFITVDSSDAGRTRIAMGAVEQMIRQAVRGVEGIVEMKSGIVNGEDAISINVSVTIQSGAHVPTVTMNIQRAIRSYIELNCGVAVREVSVSVNALESGEAEEPRRGRRKGNSPAPSDAWQPQGAPAPMAEPAVPAEAIAPAEEAAPAADADMQVPEAEEAPAAEGPEAGAPAENEEIR